MEFSKEQQKSLKEGFCRERIKKALSEERPKKTRVSRVSWDEMKIIARNVEPRIYYIRVTSQGATPITRQKYMLESECCPSSWSYAWGTKREILELCARFKITIKGELI